MKVEAKSPKAKCLTENVRKLVIEATTEDDEHLLSCVYAEMVKYGMLGVLKRTIRKVQK